MEGGNGESNLFEELVTASDKFFYDFPTSANRLKNIVKRALDPDATRTRIEEHARGTRPVIHWRVQRLIKEFLRLKLTRGTTREKEVFGQLVACAPGNEGDAPAPSGAEQDVGDGAVRRFVSRMLRCRPLVFFKRSDHALLRDGFTVFAPVFDRIGRDDEDHRVRLAEYQQYDEMQISALMIVSTPTLFINAGSRANNGGVGECNPEGVYVGAVGARFERREWMESQHVAIQKEWSIAERGYGLKRERDSVETERMDMWARFYGQRGVEDTPTTSEGEGVGEGDVDSGEYYFPSFEEAHAALERAEAEGRDIHFYRRSPTLIVNVAVYKKRMALTVETMLREANARGEAEKKFVYFFAVGLGLGVWRLCQRQGAWLVEVFAEVVQSTPLPFVADIDFSWFPEDCSACGGARSGEVIPCTNGNNVAVRFTRNNPARVLTGDDEGKLLVASYAWDSNSFPGNEYWLGMTCASGDPAAASCSTIPELQNPYINPHLTGDNLVVVEEQGARDTSS